MNKLHAFYYLQCKSKSRLVRDTITSQQNTEGTIVCAAPVALK